VALTVWSVPALLAAALWARAAWAQPKASRAARIPSFFILIRDPIAWAVTGYMCFQAALAFIVLGWVPTLLRDRGLDVVDAGIVTSVSIVAQTATALLTPVLAVRTGSPRVLVTAVLLMSVTGFLGLLYAPLERRVVWGLILGLGQGGRLLWHCSSSRSAHPRRKRQPCFPACLRASATLGPRLAPLRSAS
jgi:CP family cyanate transporter-like MFS transporter